MTHPHLSTNPDANFAARPAESRPHGISELCGEDMRREEGADLAPPLASPRREASLQLGRGGCARPGHFSGTLKLSGPRTSADLVRAIIRNTAAKHGITASQILGIRRLKRIVAARHEAMQRAYTETGFSSTQIARIFGKDHTTILYASGLTHRHARNWANRGSP